MHNVWSEWNGLNLNNPHQQLKFLFTRVEIHSVQTRPWSAGVAGRGRGLAAWIAAAAAECSVAMASPSSVLLERSRRPTRPAQGRERRKATTAVWQQSHAV